MEKAKKYEKKVSTQTETTKALGAVGATLAGAKLGSKGGILGTAAGAVVALVTYAASTVVLDEINDKS